MPPRVSGLLLSPSHRGLEYPVGHTVPLNGLAQDAPATKNLAIFMSSPCRGLRNSLDPVFFLESGLRCFLV